jgi:hypothetical protein
MEKAIKIVKERIKKLRLYNTIPYMDEGNYMITNAKIVELNELLIELQCCNLIPNKYETVGYYAGIQTSEDKLDNCVDEYNRINGTPTYDELKRLINLLKEDILKYTADIKINNITQEQIDFIYNLTILIHEHQWFGTRDNSRDRDELQEWVAKQLASGLNIYTTPCGASWGILVTKEQFEKYWKEHSKIKNIFI